MTAAPQLGNEFEIERALVARLREPMGAVRLAVQILAGPLQRALDQVDEVTRARVSSVLQTLESSTKQVCELLNAMPVIDVQAPAANGPTAAANGPMTRAMPRTPVMPVNARRPVDVDELLRRLEIVTVTRSSLPVLLSVDAHAGLQAADAGRELLPAIVGLVERAARDSAEARPHARPWTVEVRAFVDPAEILGDEMHVVLEVRHDGTPMRPEHVDEPALAAAKQVAEAAGGRIEVLSAGTKTAVRMRLPESQ